MTASTSATVPVRRERIVVGVDGSAGSAAALGWALGEARLRGVTLHAVHAWEFHPSWADPGLGSMFPLDFAPGGGRVVGMPADLSADTGVSTGEPGTAGLSPGGRLDTQAAIVNELDEVIAAAVAADSLGSTTDPVDITQAVVEGHASTILSDCVTEADLLVVGSRGHGALAGTLLGSISQHLVVHAPCPVVVVPDHRREPV